MSHPNPGSHDENGRPPAPPPPTAPPAPPVPDYATGPGYTPPPGPQVAYVDPAVEATYMPYQGDGDWAPEPQPPAGPDRVAMMYVALAISGLGFVLFWIFPAGIGLGVVGVALGVFALMGITRGGRGSKGLALSAVVLSVVTIVASTGLFIGTGSVTLIEAMRDDPGPTPPSESSASDEETSPGTPGPGDSEGYTEADWARPITATGDLLGTIEGDGFTVDVYQVATTTADQDFGEPDDRGYIAEGDEVVMFNYVATNTGDQPINVSISGVQMYPVYVQDESSLDTGYYLDDEEYGKHGIDYDGTTSDSFRDGYEVWEPGTSYAAGDGTDYRPGEAMEFEASLIPMDDNGEYDDARQVTARMTATVK